VGCKAWVKTGHLLYIEGLHRSYQPRRKTMARLAGKTAFITGAGSGIEVAPPPSCSRAKVREWRLLTSMPGPARKPRISPAAKRSRSAPT
jgi:hypothetical protein